MNKKEILKTFILLLFMFILLSHPVFAKEETEVAGTGTTSEGALTDIDKLNEMFTFGEESEDTELLAPDMKFTANKDKTIKGDSFWNEVLTQYHDVIVGVSGVCLLTFLVLFLYNLTKLGATAGNPQARKTVQVNLLWTALCVAASGTVTLFVGFSLNLIK